MEIRNVDHAYRVWLLRGRDGGSQREKWSKSLLFAFRQ